MKILVYGSNGWIGNQFVSILQKSNVDYCCGKSRVDDQDSLEKEIDAISPSHVISFIGRTHGKIGEKVFTTIDYLEEDGKLVENIRDNLFSPILLASLCLNRKIHYTYLGTGCIFKFDEDHPFGKEENGFNENSLPNFYGSSYSVVKGFTDQLMRLYKNSTLNLRIRMPITGEKNTRNFITKIVTYNKVCSVPNSMTVLPELLPYVLDMMKNQVTGTMNLTNPGLISHNEILEMYKEIVDPLFTWKNFSMEEQRKILAADRSNNFLDTTRLEKLYPQMQSIKDAIRKSLEDYRAKLDLEPKIKNLLITGGYGFIGSNFINYYFHKNKCNKLVNLDAMYYCASESNVCESIRNDKNYVFIQGNLCDMDLMDKILKDHNITHVIHFAAQSHVQNSFEDSIKFTSDNVMGTHTLLESCRRYKKIQKFIHVSTDEVYGESMNNVDETHKTEHSILCPTNPYAATKAGAELIAQSYNHSYKMPIIITRGNNVYGRGQYPEKLIPKFIKLLTENKKVTIQGNGSSVRAFLHAYDTAKAFEAILENGEIGEIYNIGCDEGMEFSVMDVAKILIKMIKKTDDIDEWIEYVEDRPYNDMRYYISNQKVKDLGWNIEVDLMTGLNDLVNQKYKINLLNLRLAENYENKKDFFGDWINNIPDLKRQFLNAEPFEHIIIPNFLNEKYAEELFNAFPEDVESGKWYKYDNPLEKKYARDDIENFPICLKQFFYLLSTDTITKAFSGISNIDDLEKDPYLHGAGLHAHPKDGILHMHLDYEKHPYLDKERRLNMILYMSKDWKEEWNGETQLWDKNMENCIVKSLVKFNTAIIFKTNEISWHGLPEKISCPEGILRKSIAYYYVSPIITKPSIDKVGNDGSGYRKKAAYKKRPQDPECEKLKKLYQIRPYRLITQQDLIDINIK
uniref:NAD(P)-binding domain-containing protein n=1 Tax=viral metagenome TaxID=1070528 RepID=A0A6C0BAK9_9ZZZZ